jgi:hypothetical protein
MQFLLVGWTRWPHPYHHRTALRRIIPRKRPAARLKPTTKAGWAEAQAIAVLKVGGWLEI